MATHKTTDTAICPHCGHRQKMIVWGVIDGNVNTKTKNRIVNGTFFDQTCKECGETFMVTYPTLFEDDAQHVMIYHTQTRMQENSAEQAIIEIRKKAPAATDYAIRIAPSIQSFREKVRIFDCCLDDRLIEIMKVAVLEKLNGDNSFGHVDNILCWVRNDGDFELEVFGEHHCMLGIKREFYTYLESKCKSTMIRKGENPVYVDFTWALEFLEENHFRCV